jgi:hypothetical protein
MTTGGEAFPAPEMIAASIWTAVVTVPGVAVPPVGIEGVPIVVIVTTSTGTVVEPVDNVTAVTPVDVLIVATSVAVGSETTGDPTAEAVDTVRTGTVVPDPV